MKKKYFLFLFIFSIYSPLKAQVNLSVYSEVSIVTAGPGTELYEAFGHSAIRIKDPVLNFDIIYNYGMFDFNQPNFLLNFAKGNMIYSLARYDFKYFLASYKKDKRWLKQQVLNLTQKEKQAYFSFLEQNAAPKNRDYLYDPYFNNCATKLRDITKNILGSKVTFNDSQIEKDLTFRNLTNNEIHWNSWGTFGLNLIAGIKLDKKVTSEESMYLPDYAYELFKNASVLDKNERKSLIKREDELLVFNEIKPTSSFLSPFLIFSLLSLLGLFITYKDVKNKRRTKTVDFLIFFTTGIIGCILIFLWFFSTHSTAPNNFNILWAFASNLVIAFFFLKNSVNNWIKKYLLILSIFLLIIPILWVIGVQEFPIIITPILIFIFVRYYFLRTILLSSIK